MKNHRSLESRNLVPHVAIKKRILLIRGQKVMLDKDLALLYGVTTKRINEQVKRNAKRFPYDFMFKLNNLEAQLLVNIDGSLRSQNATLKKTNGDSKRGKHLKYLPYVFTEQGIAMLSTVLNSERAIIVNIAIMRTFVKIRQIVSANNEIALKLQALERKFEGHDRDIITIFDAIRKIIQIEEKPKGKFGFI